MTRLPVVVMLVLLSASMTLALPQKDHKSSFKVIGQVLDRSGRPIQWGRVYVKDVHAHFLRIKAVDRDGRFSLGRLDGRLDYEVYAEQDDLVSEKISISGSQRPAEMVIALKLGKQQENH
jgi:hypothetical protein